jgi:hypothetical protein
MRLCLVDLLLLSLQVRMRLAQASLRRKMELMKIGLPPIHLLELLPTRRRLPRLKDLTLLLPPLGVRSSRFLSLRRLHLRRPQLLLRGR